MVMPLSDARERLQASQDGRYSPYERHLDVDIAEVLRALAEVEAERDAAQKGEPIMIPCPCQMHHRHPAPTPNTDRPDALHSPTYKERFQAARRRAQAAEQEVERLREALREVEWMGAAYRDDCERCPGCGRCRPRHEDDCILARALLSEQPK